MEDPGNFLKSGKCSLIIIPYNFCLCSRAWVSLFSVYFYSDWIRIYNTAQQTNTCYMSAIKTLEKGVKLIRS